MTALLGSIFLILFTVVYLFLAGAIIFHLKAYTLPGWSGGRIGILVFVLTSLALFLMLIASFLRAPWGSV